VLHRNVLTSHRQLLHGSLVLVVCLVERDVEVATLAAELRVDRSKELLMGLKSGL
jgi:hypothetical protein